jgi:signal transduction histidine kinase
MSIDQRVKQIVKSVQKLTVVDWTTLFIRIVFLLLMSLWLSLTANINFIRFAVIIFSAFIYLIVVFLITFWDSSKWNKVVGISIDMIFAYLFYYLALSMGATNLIWFSLLPLLTASLSFQWLGVFVISLLNVFLLGGLLTLFKEPEDVLLFVGLFIPLSLIIGFPLAYFSYYIDHLNDKKELEIEQKISEVSGVKFEEKQRRRLIVELISALSSSLNYERVLENSLDLSITTLSELNAPSDRLISAVLLFSEGSEYKDSELFIATSRRFLAPDLRVSLPGKSGILGKTINTGDVLLSDQVNSDPELSNFISMHHCQSVFTYPLRTAFDVYGVLLFAHPNPDFFTTERIEILEIVGNQSMIAMQNARLYEDLELEKERIMEVQEESRKKMARDLHDGPTQTVSAIAMRVNFARRLLERDVKAAGEELFKIEDLARRTTKEIRHMLFTLRPLILETQGLIAALSSMAEKMRETFKQNVIIQADSSIVDALEMSRQAVIFYIAEEGVNNARKHAQADHVWVRLELIKKDICLLEIKDDGVGFNTKEVDSSYENRTSLGMVNMRERASLVNGVIQINSAAGKGTRIQVIIPLTEEASEKIRQVIT